MSPYSAEHEGCHCDNRNHSSELRISQPLTRSTYVAGDLMAPLQEEISRRGGLVEHRFARIEYVLSDFEGAIDR